MFYLQWAKWNLSEDKCVKEHYFLVGHGLLRSHEIHALPLITH